MKRLRTMSVSVVPTMFTLGNLVCGFFAIVVAARVAKPDSPELDVANLGDLMLSGWLIFLAMVFDALDGHVARLSKTSSEFGAQLDSLCDLVTFGVAPAFLLVKLCHRFTYLHSEAIWVIAAAFVACAALRLARFNVETSEDDDHLYFRGLPSPAAAASIAGFAIMFHSLHTREPAILLADEIYGVLQFVLPFFGLFVALLMVSQIRYPHVVNHIVRGERSFGHLVALLFAVVAVMVIRGYSVPIICGAFVLSGPVRFYWTRVVERRVHQEEAF